MSTICRADTRTGVARVRSRGLRIDRFVRTNNKVDKLCRSLRNLAIVNDGAILSFSGSQNDALDGSSRFFLATLRRDFVDLVRDSRFMRVSDARG